ncbi:MAG: 2-dehydro-3-deoxygalactonokinase [Alphaproteobacteria bacterium]|nr:2-dehydro-3-deoxygalactonokinase [Alphaproteobacteria bacterium]MBV9370145.1 2-dehydro-3-deoxygalactonokinase [Alphaproteobacteria bacterium]MBV9901485.1 2-dehydro-3-deoxygalactonokinase [Alphaproteobacteria bacterium]
MRWAEGFIAVDWGTTNRRAWRIGADGAVADRMEDDKGVLSVPAGGFGHAVAEIAARLGDRPMLLAGMVGSNRGWREAPYVPCPAGLPELAGRLEWVELGRIAIVPGVSLDAGDAADVMRGEEVQVLGAYAEGLIGGDATVCHPGTHNKWIRLEDGRIAGFRTVMTGEMFSLLSGHSILADLLAGRAAPGPAFEAGVRRGLEGAELTAELFSVRARVLLGKARREDAPSFTSGLLIGADLRTGLALAGAGPVSVMGRPDLTGLFAAALALAGRPAQELEGEDAFLCGARHLAELIQ